MEKFIAVVRPYNGHRNIPCSPRLASNPRERQLVLSATGTLVKCILSCHIKLRDLSFIIDILRIA